MNRYFAGIRTVEELRKKYRELLRQHHPDNGGSEEIMKEINAEYDAVFARMSHESKADGESTACDDEAEDKAFREVLNQIIGYSMEIELIGSWIWCFNCYAYRNKLKELGFTWAAKKRAWVWHSEPYNRRHKGEIPLEKIKERYGCKTIRNHSRQCAID